MFNGVNSTLFYLHECLNMHISQTFCMLMINVADNKLVIFSIFIPENRTWHFMQIVSGGDSFAWNVESYFLEKIWKNNHLLI